MTSKILKSTSLVYSRALFIMVLSICSSLIFAQTNLTVDNQVVSYASFDNYNVTVTGNSELHLTGSSDVLTNSQIDLNSEGAWLYFDNVKPSVVLSTYLSQIKVNGVAAENESNIRIRNYKIGTLIIPHSPTYQPLEVFDGTGFSGSSIKMSTFTFYRSEVIDDDASISFPVVTLDAFSDNISSFKLKRGYMATFAQSSDGTGYSRVFVADREDIEISVMPNGLEGDVSFVRVFPWNYPSKKGFTYESGTQKLDGDWFYNWANGASSTNNVEYVPMKWGGGYAGTSFSNKSDATHMLGFNEPSHTDQSNLSVDKAIKYWSSLQKSGLRLGSPGIADNGKSWLYSFMEKADQLNLRIDFIAVHYYQGGKTASQMYNWLKDVHNRTGRPVWVTEWNNGANWTNEGDPTYEEQAADVSDMIAMMDTTSWIERYAIYNWVEAVRAVIDGDGSLTLAGDVYKAKRSPLAYNPDKDFYLDYLGLTKPYQLSVSGGSNQVNLSWVENVSGEEGIIIERSKNGGAFIEIDRVVGNQIIEYTDGSISEPGAYKYRVKYYNSTEESPYSGEVSVNILPENTLNVTVSKPVTVDSYLNSSYTGPGAVDSDITSNSSRWISANSSYPHWIEVNLKDTFNISWLSFYTGYDGYNKPPTDFELLYWDISTETWKSALTVTGNNDPEFHSSFPEVTTNKVKLNATSGVDNYFRLYEIEVLGIPYEDPVPYNVALNKPVITSSAHSSGNYSGSKAVDGNNDFDNSSRWVSDGNGMPEWIEIDLEGSFVIDRMKIYIGDYNDEGPFSDFDFQYWNGDSWTTIITKSGNTNFNFENVFDKVTTSKVRMNITAGLDIVRLHEIEVFGYEEGTTSIGNQSFDQEYSIYPNPTSGNVNIKGLKTKKEISVIDLSGRVVLSQKTEKQLDIQHLECGVYFVKIDSENVIRIVKK